MRKVLILLLVLLLTVTCSGCKIPKFSQFFDTDRSRPTESKEHENENENEKENQTLPDPQTATYTIQREDRSYKNDRGEVLIQHWYDLVVLQGESDGIRAINQSLNDEMAGFFMSEKELAESAEFPYLTPETAFLSTCEAEVTHNANGVFCIKFSTDWMMGGVYTGNYYGKTFQLKNGLPATLTELTGQDADSLEKRLKEIVWNYLTTEWKDKIDEYANNTLEEYTLEKFNFSIENGKIVLLFPTYTFSCGAVGPTIVPTDIHIIDKDN